MDEPHRIVLPDSIVTGLAAGSPSGPIYMTSIAKGTGPGVTQTTLSSVDLSGRILWQRIFDGSAGIPRAIGGSVWLAQHGPDGATLEETDRDGAATRSFALEQCPDETLGAVLILSDGFCTAWTSGPPYRGARIDRRDADGACIWSAAIAPDQIAHNCILETSAETGWVSHPKRPWTPGTFQLHPWEPLLISGDRILATYQELRSGLGISYFLDIATGRIVNTTKPAPIGRKAITGKGEFLIGMQGYDEFVTVLYNRAGGQTARWPTHAAVLTDRTGRLLGAELDNRAAAKPRLRIMERDGTLSDGPQLAGYHTALPALDSDGTAVFWRSGRLLTADADLTLHEIFTAEENRNFTMGRVLLLEDGIVAFNLSQELFILRTTLGPLENSAWPCGEGNINGNPVMFVD